MLVTQVFRFHLLVPIHLLHLRSSSIAEINLKKKLRDEEINKLEKSPLASSKQKQKQKKFANANAGKIEVIVKSKTKLKNSKQKLKDREPWIFVVKYIWKACGKKSVNFNLHLFILY